jgi:hypothetical protein
VLSADFDAPGEPVAPEYTVSAISADAVDVELVIVGDVTSPAQTPTEGLAFHTPRGWKASGYGLPTVSRSR